MFDKTKCANTIHSPGVLAGPVAVLAGVAILSCGLSHQKALAQQPQSNQGKMNYQLPNLLKSRPATTQTQHLPDEFKPDKLTGIVELPNVPNYTGHAVFVSGLKYPRDRSGMRIGMTIGVREDENEVLEWYKSALKTYRWTVLNSNPTDKYVSAAKDKNTFTVRISPSKQPGFRTLVVLSYKFGI